MIQQGQRPMQGSNARAAVTTDQIIATAEVTSAPDYGQLQPVVDAALRDPPNTGVTQRSTAVLADVGY